MGDERTEATATAATSSGATTSGTGAASAAGATPRAATRDSEGLSDRSAASGASSLTASDRVKFRCIRNAAYHEDRERHYVRLHKAALFVVVLSGTAAFGTVVGNTLYALIATFVATTAGVCDLVFQLDTSARLHNSIRQQVIGLYARCEAGEDCSKLDVALIELYADEPPTMHCVNAVAHNLAVDALGRPRGQRFVIGPWASLLRHWWPFRSDYFKTENEIREAAT